MSGTRIRPDKQIQTAPGAGYVLHSDINGELQFALLAALVGSGGGNTDYALGDIRSIDSLQLLGNVLVLRYTNNQGIQFVKSCDLSALAVDVKVTDAILQRTEANTYILQLTENDGSTVLVNLSDLLAIVTVNTSDIILSGNGTANDPLSAFLSDNIKKALKGTHWTDEFTGLTTGSTVQLTYKPTYPFPLHVYRNGIRQKEFIDWRYNVETPKTITLLGASFGANAQSETVIVDYMTEDATTTRQVVDGQIK